MLSRTNTILVATDFSEAAELALQSAMELAQLWHCSLELLHVISEPAIVDMAPGGILPIPADLSQIIAGQKALLEETASRVRQLGILCRSSTATGKPHKEIIDHALKVEAGLIVMGTHEHRGLDVVLSNHVAEKVLHRAPCPMLLVPVLPTSSLESNLDEAEEPVAPAVLGEPADARASRAE